LRKIMGIIPDPIPKKFRLVSTSFLYNFFSFMKRVIRFFNSLIDRARKDNALAMKKDAHISSLKNFFNFFPPSKK